MKTRAWLIALLMVAATGAVAQEALPEATSLLGQPLYPPVLSPESRARLEENLAQAQAAYEKSPDDAEALIWLGRRTAYLGRYRDAIAIFTEGIKKHPGDARFYRHRGHRFLTVRGLSNAISDLEKAAQLISGQPDEVEPDGQPRSTALTTSPRGIEQEKAVERGQPNPQNIPRSTLHSNIWYHLGLAYYLTGDFPHAAFAYNECLKVSTNDDMRVATANWLYLTLRRLGRDKQAQELLNSIHPDMDIIENFAYHKLLLMHKGELAPDEVMAAAESDLDRATLGYGVAMWHLLNDQPRSTASTAGSGGSAQEKAVERGQPDKARALFEQIVAGPLWPAFGHLAAEAELARRQ